MKRHHYKKQALLLIGETCHNFDKIYENNNSAFKHRDKEQPLVLLYKYVDENYPLS
jgi:hypothetical protein